MKKILSLLLACALAVGLLSSCSNSTDDPETNTPSPSQNVTTSEEVGDPAGDTADYVPVTIENNGITTTYEKAPERVVVLSYTIAELFVALGLEDNIIALAPQMNQITEVQEQYRDAIAALPVFPDSGMTDGVPTLETILSYEPDFVMGTVYSFFAQNCGEPADYAANNINIYAAEGTCVAEPTLQNVYNDIENIAKIFGVEDRAEKLIADFESRVEKVETTMEGVDPVSVFVFDTDLGQGVLYTTAGATLEDYLIKLAGGRNIFADLNEQYARVSFEEIIAQDPEYIIVTNYYTDDDAQTKIDYFKSQPEFSELTAVKNDNFLILSGLEAWPGLQSVNGLEKIAEALHPEVFSAEG